MWVIFMKTIELSQQSEKRKGKYFAKVDDEDYDYLMQWKWQVKVEKTNNYAQRIDKSTGKRVVVFMHRTIFGADSKKTLVDHRDLDGLNNQRINLRKCSRTQNGTNTRSRIGSTSKYLGVSWHTLIKAKSKWRATIKFENKCHYLGSYDNEEDAARAYDAAATIYHGEFANLNFK